jgi:hypothetical protein
MAPLLQPCESCARHVRISETACPFCGAAVASAPEAAAPAPFARPLSRAALLFMGVTAATGCSSAPSVMYGPAIIEDSGATVDSGGEAIDSGGATVDSGGGGPDGGLVAAYGPGSVQDSG